MQTEELVEKIQREFEINSNEYEPFIRHIRFPKYKNIEHNAKLSITFPLTVLVGENGSNKSSVIRAFYGAPVNKSLGDYWFETKIDRIKDEDETKPSCFIYGYVYPIENKIVEVLKTRVKKDQNQDYWEPSRPILAYDMEPIEQKDELSDLEREYRSKTRWNAIKKDVIYLDFRHEALSAYDKFFYCTDLGRASTRIKTKQDYIRRYSANIKEVIDKNLKSCVLYKKNRVIDNKILDNKVVRIISEILDKKYDSIRILTHSFYTSEPAKTVILSSENGSKYSEAFAGSGEFSVVCLVDAIINAKNKALILLDEPEVSIHPNAQKKLLIFLLKQILAKKLQIVLATHSPYFTNDLPRGALKLLRTKQDGTVCFDNAIQSAEVFYEIGASKRQLTVVVEDNCAKIVLDACLRNLNKLNLFNVCFSGRHGYEGILKHDAATDFTQGLNDIVYYLDGDVRKKWIAENEDLPEQEVIDLNLRKIAESVTLSQSNTKSSDVELLRSRFIQYLRDRVYFLPDSYGPEEIIWKVIPGNENNISPDGNDYKEAIRKLCYQQYRKEDAEHIKLYQYSQASWLLQDSHITEFDTELKNVVDNLVNFYSKVISTEH